MLIILIVTFLLKTVIPLIGNQVMSLVNNFPVYGQQLQHIFDNLVDSSVMNQLQQWMKINPNDIVQRAAEQTSAIIHNAWATIGAFLGKLTEIVLAIVTVPFVLFYLLRDGKKLPRYILRFFAELLARLQPSNYDGNEPSDQLLYPRPDYC